MLCFYINSYENKHPFIHKKIFQKLSDIFHQEAFSTITSTQSKLRTYDLLKKQISIEKYLYEIPNPIIRHSCTKFRLSNHTLNIETGRHINIPKELHFCPFCPNSIESEIHFLIECRTYKTLRDEILHQLTRHKPSFEYYTQIEKFNTFYQKKTYNLPRSSYMIALK